MTSILSFCKFSWLIADNALVCWNTGTQDGGTVITRTIMMGGGEPSRKETIRQTTMPTEIIQKTITIEGDGNQLTAEELKDIIAKHAGDIGSSEVVTTVSELRK